MQIPCPACGVLTRFETQSSTSSSVLVDCPACAGRFRIAIQARQPASESADYSRARTFAKEHGIDVPTAYSVLEGLISLDEAQGTHDPARAQAVREESHHARKPGGLGGGERTVATQRKPQDPTSSARELNEPGYDPGFADAVRDECLTIQQAMERGDRRALADRISTRHRLPMDLAYQAADNRITIRQAVMQKVALEKKPLPVASSPSSEPVWKWGALAVCIVIFMVVLLQLRSQHAAASKKGILLTSEAGGGVAPAASSEAPAPDVPLPPPPLTIPKVDTAGQLIEISGPDPRSVLVSFCMSGRQAGQRAPLVVAYTVPPSAGFRLGLFRNIADPGGVIRSILIRKDTLTSQWVAGNGRAPILTEEFSGPLPTGDQRAEASNEEPPRS